MFRNIYPERIPYWRLSGFYFFVFVMVGILLPFWSLYLKSIGMDSRQIGILSSIIVFSKIFITYFWGWVVDQTGRRMRVIQISVLLSAVIFSAAIFIHDFFGLAIILFIFSIFWSASLPQIEAATMNHLGDATHLYTSIRVWGSVGFIFSVWLLGEILDVVDIGYVPGFIFVAILIVWFVSLSVPEKFIEDTGQKDPQIKPVLLTPQVIALFVICFLMLLSHGPYYTFYSIYLEEHGYSRSFIGQMWALGVLAEVVLFMLMQFLLKHFSLKQLLLASFLLAAVRWVLIAFFVDSLLILLFAQVLHAGSFGSYHAVAIQYIHGYFQGRLQGRGQALYSSISFGAGMAIGSLLSGFGWDIIGAQACFSIAAISAIAGLVIARKYLPA